LASRGADETIRSSRLAGVRRRGRGGL